MATVAVPPSDLRSWGVVREALWAPRDGAAGFRLLSIAMVGGAVSAPCMDDLGSLCVLRRLTGIPCPGCGMRSGVTEIVHGDLASAVGDNPLSVVLVLVVFGAWLNLVLRVVRPNGRGAGLWVRRPPGWAVGATFVASWTFQLVRFGHL